MTSGLRHVPPPAPPSAPPRPAPPPRPRSSVTLRPRCAIVRSAVFLRLYRDLSTAEATSLASRAAVGARRAAALEAGDPDAAISTRPGRPGGPSFGRPRASSRRPCRADHQHATTVPQGLNPPAAELRRRDEGGEKADQVLGADGRFGRAGREARAASPRRRARVEEQISGMVRIRFHPQADQAATSGPYRRRIRGGRRRLLEPEAE